jgi:uncharacterized glyoxalase superfamily protein PhnB
MKPNIFPILRYRDAPAAIAWLCQAFGFESQLEVPGPDGTVIHSQLTLGAGVVGASSATPDDGKNPWSGVDQMIYVCIPDPDAHHARAKEAGAQIVIPPHDLDYGSRDYGARDSEGHLWGFGTYSMADAPGAPTLSPGLRYEDGSGAIEFLTKAFGFEKGVVVPGPDGAIAHAELWLEPGLIMLGSVKRQDDAQVWGRNRQSISAVVEDPDSHYAKAKSAGAKIVHELADTPYGSRGYSAHDVEGKVWTFGTYRPKRSS